MALYLLTRHPELLEQLQSGTVDDTAADEIIRLASPTMHFRRTATEDTMLGAVMFGHEAYQAVITGIIELAQATAKEPWDLPEAPAGVADVAAKVRDMAEADLRVAYGEQEKSLRQEKIGAVKEKIVEAFSGEEDVESAWVSGAFKDL